MNNYKSLLAHYDKDEKNKKQYLVDHLLEASRHAGQMGKLLKLENTSRLIALLHDFGKSKEDFQLYIKGKYYGRVDHSSAGGMMVEHIAEKVYKDYAIEKLLEEKGLKKNIWMLYKEILQYPILAHHGLYDIIDNDFNYRTQKRFERNKNEAMEKNSLEFLYKLNKEYINLNKKSIYHMYYKGFKEFLEINEKIRSLAPEINEASNRQDIIVRKKSIQFYYGALVRLLLSILKDADIYDSSNYYRSNKDKTYSSKELDSIWNEMGGSIEGLYSKFNSKTNKSDLDKVRTDLANEIYNFSQKYDRGAYKLDMPVGSGKTYAGLRYAIGNAKRFHKSRIFYCTAFLSVLEQNASSIREIVGDRYVLEHHSNIIQDYEEKEELEDEKDYQVQEYLKESWESPLILTTLVQLSNSLFKHKSSNIRRFSKLINSVLIIDEIQSLPVKAIFNFNLMTNFLAEIMNCTVIHSTATPPNLDNKKALRYPCNYGSKSGEASIIKSIDRGEVFSRVDYYSLLGESLDRVFNSRELSDHIKAQLECEKSVLLVLNTKKAVENLYNTLVEEEELIEDNTEIIYLTTNQCPKHRLEIIENMKKRLKDLRNNKDERKLICVSTKLVEAGVDIDFDLVYRSLAGIDSIIQCGGRCNREGKKSSRGKLFILKYEDENLKYLVDIKKQAEAAETAFKISSVSGEKNENMDMEKICKDYFQKLYLNEEEAGNYLSYPLEEQENILNLLTTNPNLVANYKTSKGKKPDFYLRQSFKTAAFEFDLIKENTLSVIVQYKNEEIIDKLYQAIELKDFHNVKILLRELQPYTVSIRRVAEYENYITKELEGEIFILSKEAYDKKLGLVKGELQSLCF